MNALVAAWWAWMPSACWQSALVVALVLVIERLIPPRRWPELFAGLWTLALIKLMLPPTLRAPWSLALVAPVDLAGLEGFAAEPSSLSLVLLAIWLTGVLLLGALAIERYRRLRRAWLKQARPAPGWLVERGRRAARRLGLRGAPRIWLAESATGIAVVGLRRPAIVVPRDLPARLTRSQLDAVLLHELAHVCRRDGWRSALVMALQIIYWFHPAAWLIRARLAALQEVACDARAVAVLGDRRGYAQTLVRIAAGDWALAAPGLAFLRRRSQLVERLERLGEPSAGRHWAACPAAALFALCCLPLGAALEPTAPRVAARLAPVASAADVVDDPGCLRLRMQVFAALAREEQSHTSSIY